MKNRMLGLALGPTGRAAGTSFPCPVGQAVPRGCHHVVTAKFAFRLDCPCVHWAPSLYVLTVMLP